MMAANYRHIGGQENRLGRHYSRFPSYAPAAPLCVNHLQRKNSAAAGRIGEVRLGENQGEKLFYDTAPAKKFSLINQLGAVCPVKSCREQGGFDDLLTKAFMTANTRQRLLIRRR